MMMIKTEEVEVLFLPPGGGGGDAIPMTRVYQGRLNWDAAVMPRPKIPSIDSLISHPLLADAPARLAVQAARLAVDELRAEALAGKDLSLDDFAACAEAALDRLTSMRTRPAINLSGVVLHTGIGRARLAESAAQAVTEAAKSHAVVEFDIETGARGDRQSHVEDLLCELTGAQAALVVNNCASAVLLTLTALAKDKEVILSRGEMVEIGGSFRMPDIVRASGCSLVEVGCTNKTHLKDYADACTDETAAFLKCHPSSYQVVGFTAAPIPELLAELAHDKGLTLIDDLGSGCLVDSTKWGLRKERTLAEAVKSGADVVLASGDKLLGGPQAGIIVGRASVVKEIARHPLARAVRIDKLTLAGLEATLRLYREGREDEIPIWRSLGRSDESLRWAARKLAGAWNGQTEVVRADSRIGGGSLPGMVLPTWCASITADSASNLARALRKSSPAIVGRIEGGAVLLDPRTAEADEIQIVCRKLKELSK